MKLTTLPPSVSSSNAPVMKQIHILLLGLSILLVFQSCSKDNSIEFAEEEVVAPEPTVEELLIDSSPWTFTNYEVLDIISTTDENITNIEINENFTALLDGFTIDFSEDGEVIINHPISGELTRTWVLFNDAIIFNSESSTPQIWQNIDVSEDHLSIESHLITIFEGTFTIVEHYGTLNFE